MSAPGDLLNIVAGFARTRWGSRFSSRAAVSAWQSHRLQAFFQQQLPRAPYYQRFVRQRSPVRLDDLPITDKQTLLTHFDALNTRGITFDDAMTVALAAERSRDFSPELGDVTVGMSSGTSGQRGLFLVSRHERLLWAGTIFARALSAESLARIASPWQPPLAIALFLRANSNLYSTLHSRRVDFAFYDLLQPLDVQIDALSCRPPEVLVAPATVLRRLAEAQCSGALRITPRQVISVAETLEPDDAALIETAFARRVEQVYQATEGFLGYTCAAGGLHLNEACVHVEPEWLDAAHTRFHPIITDFTRHTQLIVRYRLDDVLRVAEKVCPCGDASLTLAAIDGRRDAVLTLPARSGGEPRAIFPDLVRRAMMLAGGSLRDYRIAHAAAGLEVRLLSRDPDVAAVVRHELLALFEQQDVVAPAIAFLPWRDEPAGDKRCRIRRLAGAEHAVEVTA
jgi:putative adenylate-forming enzyme